MEKKLTKKHRHFDRIKAKLAGVKKTAKARERQVAKIAAQQQ